MNISEGLFNNSVLQRNEKNLSEAEFRGDCKHTGKLKAYITCNQKPVEGFSPSTIGNAEKGSFNGCIKGLPAGGPYNIEVTIEDQEGKAVDNTSINNVLVGDVWILAGQSNMEGIGYIKDSLQPEPMVHAFYMDDHWDVAQDPLHLIGDAVDQVHIDLSGGSRPVRIPHIGIGPGISFAQEMYKLTGIPQGVIACAHGGTSMVQWEPALKNRGGKSLYGAMIRRFAKNGSKAAGMVWYQGCNETNPDSIPFYTSRMKEFAEAVRRDFGNSNFPIVAVQLSRVCYPPSSGADWNAIQEQQRLLPEVIEKLFVVPSIDLSFDDFIHLSGFDQNRLGIRCAKAMTALRHEAGNIKPPVTLKGIEIEKDQFSGSANVIVTFDNVMGKLQAQGRPSGFELTEKRNELSFHSIYRIDLDGNKAILKTTFNCMDDVKNQFLHYGLGVQPYCNITDSFDRSLPVIGPVRLGEPKAFSVVIVSEISKVLLSGGKLDALEYPKDMDALEFSERNFYYMFLNTHDLLAKTAPDDAYLYYLVRIECEEKMDLNIYLGYDGPVKMWVDKKEIFHDPNGTNPAIADDSINAFEAAQGQHEIIVAMGSNFGKAWGIFLRFERMDIPPELVEMGPGNYKVPRILGQ